MGGRQVDLVQDRHQLEVVFQRHIGIGEGLSLHTLGGVHHEDSAFTGGEAAADFVSEVHVARGVDEVELVHLAVLGGVVHGDGAGLDGDAAFPLDVHVVEDLVHALGQLEDAVGQGGFAVVDVRDDAEVADVVSCHVVPPKFIGSSLRRP